MPSLTYWPAFDRAKNPLVVGLVLGKQQRDFSLTVQEPVPQFIVGSGYDTSAVSAGSLFQDWFWSAGPPSPGIPEP